MLAFLATVRIPPLPYIPTRTAETPPPLWNDGDMEEDRRKQAEEKADGGIDDDMVEWRDKTGGCGLGEDHGELGIEGGVRRLVGIEGKEKDG